MQKRSSKVEFIVFGARKWEQFVTRYERSRGYLSWRLADGWAHRFAREELLKLGCQPTAVINIVLLTQPELKIDKVWVPKFLLPRQKWLVIPPNQNWVTTYCWIAAGISAECSSAISLVNHNYSGMKLCCKFNFRIMDLWDFDFSYLKFCCFEILKNVQAVITDLCIQIHHKNRSRKCMLIRYVNFHFAASLSTAAASASSLALP